MQTFEPDTADRVRPCDLIRVDGRTLLVTSTAAAPTPSMPRRLAVEAYDPGSGHRITVWPDAGETLPIHRAKG